MVAVLDVNQEPDDGLGPVRSVAQKTEIGEWFLGRTESIFPLGQGIREIDEQATPSLTLMLRQAGVWDEDAVGNEWRVN